MKLIAGVAVVLAAFMAFAPVAPRAEDAATPANTLTLVIGGEAYNGSPDFAVSFDGKPLGEGTVAAAIDSKTGRFEDASNKAKYVQNFEFKIPDEMFKKDGEVRVRLTNEARGDAGSGQERRLYVASIAVNGGEMAASKFTAQSKAGVEPVAMLDSYLVLSDGNTEAVLAAPSAGWPAPEAPVASVAPKPEATPKPDTTASTAPNAEPQPAAATVTPAVSPAIAATEPTKPAVVPADKPAAIVAAAAAPAEKPPAPKPTPAPAQTASLAASDKADGSACQLDKSFHILGFNENSNNLTPRVFKQLDSVARAIGEQKCKVRITGYSSIEGSYADNALFSLERAQNTLQYLSGKGVKFARYSAAGVGETTQFGAAAQLNRRVVITVTP